MVLLDDVVQIFALSKFDVQAGVVVDTFDSRCVGTALVDGDLLRQTVQVDGSLQKAPGRSLVSLGAKEGSRPCSQLCQLRGIDTSIARQL